MQAKLSRSSTSSRTKSTTAGGGRRTVIAKSRFNRRRYVELLAMAAPRVITNDEDLKQASQAIRPLLFKKEGTRTPEEDAFVELMLRLIDDYQEKHTIIPKLKPHELLQAIMEEAGLRQADLLDIFGSRSRVSDAVNGKRAIIKEQAKRLCERFSISPAAFI
ncbi:MAG: helix-turn-helix domain-containing protein [Blastocatellia bacterium]